jgi:hypothetical protein
MWAVDGSPFSAIPVRRPVRRRVAGVELAEKVLRWAGGHCMGEAVAGTTLFGETAGGASSMVN